MIGFTDEECGHGNLPGINLKHLSGLNCLLCEDSETNRRIISGKLRSLGLAVTEVSDGEMGIEAVSQSPDKFSLVFMDVYMPKLSGIRATEKIREMGYSIPIIIISASITPDERLSYMSLGATECLSKSADLQELSDCILKCLGLIKKNIDAIAVTKQAQNKIIDMNAGIRNCVGEESFYREILNDYVNRAEDAYKQVEAAFHAGDENTAYLIAHREASTASLIGASRLSAAASALARAIRDMGDISYCDEDMLKDYYTELHCVLEEIRTLSKQAL